jgi:chromosome segregation ATPase
MADSRRPTRKSTRPTAPARPQPATAPSSRSDPASARPRASKPAVVAREEGDSLRPGSVATVRATIAALREQLAERDAQVARLSAERETEADTMAQMLVRIAELERRPDPSLVPARAPSDAKLRDLEDRLLSAEARVAAAEARATDEAARAEDLARELQAQRTRTGEAEVRARQGEEARAIAEESARAARDRAVALSEEIERLSTPREDPRARQREEALQRELADLREELELARDRLEASIAAREEAQRSFGEQIGEAKRARECEAETVGNLRVQMRALEARVEAVGRHLAWTDDAAAVAGRALEELETRAREDRVRLGEAIAAMRHRAAVAREVVAGRFAKEARDDVEGASFDEALEHDPKRTTPSGSLPKVEPPPETRVLPSEWSSPLAHDAGPESAPSSAGSLDAGWSERQSSGASAPPPPSGRRAGEREGP